MNIKTYTQKKHLAKVYLTTALKLLNNPTGGAPDIKPWNILNQCRVGNFIPMGW